MFEKSLSLKCVFSSSEGISFTHLWSSYIIKALDFCESLLSSICMAWVAVTEYSSTSHCLLVGMLRCCLTERLMISGFYSSHRSPLYPNHFQGWCVPACVQRSIWIGLTPWKSFHFAKAGPFVIAKRIFIRKNVSYNLMHILLLSSSASIVESSRAIFNTVIPNQVYNIVTMFNMFCPEHALLAPIEASVCMW